MTTLKRFLTAFALVMMPLASTAQSTSALISKGDELFRSYDFKGALEQYGKALKGTMEESQRSAVAEKVILCENGIGMLQYATNPFVVTSKTVARKDFHLWYGHIADGTWAVDQDGELQYYGSDAKLVLSKKNGNGDYDLMATSRINEKEWSLPTTPDGLSSSENEIYPYVTPDGNNLYFSSRGLVGMGGYDLFVSRWDSKSKSWGSPENLGFPFSSPFDDLLFTPTPDGKFSVFASNRACSADSIVIYVLKYDAEPVKSALDDLGQIRSIASLKAGKKRESDGPNRTIAATPGTEEYVAKFEELHSVKDSIRNALSRQASIRSHMETAPESDLKALEIQLRRSEESVMDMQGDMEIISKELQEIEMELLLRGIHVDAGALESALDEAGKEAEPEEELVYEFVRRKAGKAPQLLFEQPEVPEDDYTFKITDKSEIVSDFTIPDGIIYQVQIAVVSKRAAARDFKGVTPIFEKRQSSGKYVYAAGMFHTYDAAQSALSKIKAKGMRDAIIIAMRNGKGISLKQARADEAAGGVSMYRIVIDGYPDGLPTAALASIQKHTSKELAKSSRGGSAIYLLAPFDSRDEALSVAAALAADGVECSVEEIK